MTEDGVEVEAGDAGIVVDLRPHHSRVFVVGLLGRRMVSLSNHEGEAPAGERTSSFDRLRMRSVEGAE